MNNKFTEVMANRSNAELLKIVNEEREDYQPEAVEAAEKELEKRNLNFDQIKEANNENEIKEQIEFDKANEDLDLVVIDKLCFLYITKIDIKKC